MASFIIVFTANSSNIELKEKKKAEKKIFKFFSRKDIKQEFISDYNLDVRKYGDFTNMSVSKLICSDGIIAYAMYNSSIGRTDYFDYMILFDVELNIISSMILAYRSNYGSEIASGYWLKQFDGKSNGELMNAVIDIDIISGATLSGKSFAKGAQGLSRLLYALKENGSI